MAQTYATLKKESIQLDLLDFSEGFRPSLKFVTQSTRKSTCLKQFTYELRYTGHAKKNSRMAEVLILVKTKVPAKASTLVCVARNAIRSSGFITIPNFQSSEGKDYLSVGECPNCSDMAKGLKSKVENEPTELMTWKCKVDKKLFFDAAEAEFHMREKHLEMKKWVAPEEEKQSEKAAEPSKQVAKRKYTRRSKTVLPEEISQSEPQPEIVTEVLPSS